MYKKDRMKILLVENGLRGRDRDMYRWVDIYINNEYDQTVSNQLWELKGLFSNMNVFDVDVRHQPKGKEK